MAQVNVIAKSNVVTETEHESALEQISYLETSSVQRSHQVYLKSIVTASNKKYNLISICVKEVSTGGSLTVTRRPGFESHLFFILLRRIFKLQKYVWKTEIAEA